MIDETLTHAEALERFKENAARIAKISHFVSTFADAVDQYRFEIEYLTKEQARILELYIEPAIHIERKGIDDETK